MHKRLIIIVITIAECLTALAIDPHGSRLDRDHGSGGGGAIFAAIILVVAVIIYLVMKFNDSSNNKTNTSSYQMSESERWELRKRQQEKEDKDLETGLKWGCGLPLLFVIVYILNYYFHFIV